MRKHMLLALGGLLLLTRALGAQNTDIESLAGITFNFANPGARSMGMGGAFLGLADDASAAEANPAGLTILGKSEISLEVRHWRNVAELAVSGIFPELGIGEFASFSRTAEVTFGSVVIPMGNFALAAYYHQPLNYSNAATVLAEYDSVGNAIPGSVPRIYFTIRDMPGTNVPISEEECFADVENCRYSDALSFVTAVAVKMKTMGLAGAWKIGRLSLGATARYHQFRELALTTRFDKTTVTSAAVQATEFDNEEPGTEDDVTFTAGFKWVISDKISVGGSYKLGPEFRAPTFKLIPDQSADFQKVADTNFHVPDVAGLGISFKPIDPLTINVDGVHITYSNLVDDFQSDTTGIVRFDENNQRIVILEDPFTAEDVTEIHVGAEYFFPTRIPIAIRAGWWHDPAHSMTYSGPLTCTEDVVPVNERLNCVANRTIQAILFPEGKDLNHYSLGLGLAWPTFQIDAAYDTSEGLKVGSISGVFRF